MKKVLLVLCLMAFPLTGFAGEKQEPTRQISVSGEAEIKVVPDEAVVSFTVENKEVSLLEATQANDASVRRVLELAKKLGIDKKYIQTDRIYIAPRYRNCNYNKFDDCHNMKPMYYEVRKGIRILLKDLSKYDELVSKSVEHGVKYINGVQFTSSKIKKLQEEAQEMAAANARQKAQRITKALNVKLRKPLHINAEGVRAVSNFQRANRNMDMMYAAEAAPSQGAGGPSIALGQISVKVTVHVTFEIE